ncbi:MAG: MerR family transcriptional regulator [Candidatus Kapaibacterium sp.]
MKNNQTEKLYYSISDVSQIIDEEQYVLRYWEREFAEIKPRKNRAGNRAYTAKDVAIVLTIKRLLRNDRLTIQGARDVLRTMDIDAIEEYKPSPAEISASLDASGSTTKRKQKGSTAGSPQEASGDMVSLRRQDVLDLCRLLKDMAVLIQYM